MKKIIILLFPVLLYSQGKVYITKPNVIISWSHIQDEPIEFKIYPYGYKTDQLKYQTSVQDWQDSSRVYVTAFDQAGNESEPSNWVDVIKVQEPPEPIAYITNYHASVDELNTWEKSGAITKTETLNLWGGATQSRVSISKEINFDAGVYQIDIYSDQKPKLYINNTEIALIGYVVQPLTRGTHKIEIVADSVNIMLEGIWIRTGDTEPPDSPELLSIKEIE